MSRCGLLLVLSFFAATTFAPQASAALSLCSDGKTDPNPFVNKVYTLSSSFDPSATSPYSAPAPILSVAGTANLIQYAQDLASAYCIASPTVRAQLNDLTSLFITCSNPSVCAPSGQSALQSSWGYRENVSNQSILQHTYIGVSANLWPPNAGQPPNQPPMIYSDLEYAIINGLWSPPAVVVTPLPQATNYITINPVPNNSALTVLALLTHELGHINWYKANFSRNFNCSGQYQGYSWQTVQGNPNQFHKFGDQGTGNQIHNNHSGLGDTIKAINATNGGKLIKALVDIYSGNFASLFATAAPDEDFVETYKLSALSFAGLQHLYVTVINNPPVDLIGQYLQTSGSGELYTKINFLQSCFAGLVDLPATGLQYHR
jgi:hypothetical protein